MLQYRTVYPETLELLRKLMKLRCLDDFFLVGGTALALQLGHRISVDLDLFTLHDFDVKKTSLELTQNFQVTDLSEESNTLNFNIVYPEKSKNIVKIDLIKYSYPLIKSVQETGDIRLLYVEDIIPMKLSAVAGRGSKKDFYDIYYLLKDYSMDQLFSFFRTKFPDTNEFHILKSLTYFEDAEIEPDPITIEKTDWNQVKDTISKKTKEYISK